MSLPTDDARRIVDELGARIDAKLAEINRSDLFHTAEREQAADLKINQQRLATALAQGHKTPTTGDDLKSDIELLKRTFERWMVRVDKNFQSSS